MSDFGDELPEDLRETAARLAAARLTPTPLELDELRRRVRMRVQRDAGSPRRFAWAAPRLTSLAARVLSLALVLAVAAGVAIGGWSAANGSGPAKDTTIGFLNAADLSSPTSAACSQYGDCCPAGTTPSFQWHYSADGSSGSWSATTAWPCPSSISMGPQDMEGDQKLTPGTIVSVGYEFDIPGNNSTVTVTVTDPQVTFIVDCVTGTPLASTFTATMPSAQYTTSGSGFVPGFAYEGSVAVPDDCNGGLVRLDKGGTFTASVS